MLEILKNLDYSPLIISLKTGVVATIISFVIGTLFALWVVRRHNLAAIIVDGILTLPMALPPTAAGFFLLLLFSRRRPFGTFLYETFDITFIQNWAGCVLAATVIALPLMYRNAKVAFELLDENLIFAARTLGMSEWKIFWKIILPLSKPGLFAGAILTFARAMGEYGATSMLAGNIAGKTGGIAQRIAMVIQDGDYQTAGVWTVIILLIAFLIITLMNVMLYRSQKHRRKW